MHMADGLLSPEVGVAMWAVTAGATAVSYTHLAYLHTKITEIF